MVNGDNSSAAKPGKCRPGPRPPGLTCSARVHRRPAAKSPPAVPPQRSSGFVENVQSSPAKPACRAGPLRKRHQSRGVLVSPRRRRWLRSPGKDPWHNESWLAAVHAHPGAKADRSSPHRAAISRSSGEWGRLSTRPMGLKPSRRVVLTIDERPREVASAVADLSSVSLKEISVTDFSENIARILGESLNPPVPVAAFSSSI